MSFDEVNFPELDEVVDMAQNDETGAALLEAIENSVPAIPEATESAASLPSLAIAGLESAGTSSLASARNMLPDTVYVKVGDKELVVKNSPEVIRAALLHKGKPLAELIIGSQSPESKPGDKPTKPDTKPEKPTPEKPNPKPDRPELQPESPRPDIGEAPEGRRLNRDEMQKLLSDSRNDPAAKERLLRHVRSGDPEAVRFISDKCDGFEPENQEARRIMNEAVESAIDQQGHADPAKAERAREWLRNCPNNQVVIARLEQGAASHPNDRVRSDCRNELERRYRDQLLRRHPG